MTGPSAYFDRLASDRRRVIEYPEGHHTLEFDPDPSRYARDLVGWLGEALEPADRANLGRSARVVRARTRSTESRRSAVDQDKKRELRQLKREIKRAGGKRADASSSEGSPSTPKRPTRTSPTSADSDRPS